MGKNSQNDIDLNIGSKSRYGASERAEMLMRNRNEARMSEEDVPGKRKKSVESKASDNKKKKNTVSDRADKRGTDVKYTGSANAAKNSSAAKNKPASAAKQPKDRAYNVPKKKASDEVNTSGNKRKKENTAGNNQHKKPAGEKIIRKVAALEQTAEGMRKTTRSSIAKKKSSVDNGISKSKSERMDDAAVIRRKKNKQGFVFKVGGILLIIFVLLYIGAAYILFNINEIETVNPGKKYTEEQILAAADINSGDNLLRISASSKENTLSRVLPYIEKAKITKNWPNKLTVEIEYATAAISLKNGEAYIYINSAGKVLEYNAPAPAKNSAIIKGAAIITAEPGETIVLSDEYLFENMHTVAQAVEKNGIKKVTGYDLKNPADISITVDDRIEVRIGSSANAEKKLAFGKVIIDKQLNDKLQRNIMIDLTGDKAAYVRAMDKSEDIIESMPYEEGALPAGTSAETTKPDNTDETQTTEKETAEPSETDTAEIPSEKVSGEGNTGEIVEFG